jgi:hypothetical protein
MRLIVNEVLLELAHDEPWLDVRLEGSTYYPDARVFCRTLEGPPGWINGQRLRRRARDEFRRFES